VHNPRVRRLFAACLLVLFAALATADTFACPDGCQTASSGAIADQRNASGTCVFCTGGVLRLALPAIAPPTTAPLPAQDLSSLHPPVQPAPPLDHPPRLT